MIFNPTDGSEIARTPPDRFRIVKVRYWARPIWNRFATSCSSVTSSNCATLERPMSAKKPERNSSHVPERRMLTVTEGALCGESLDGIHSREGGERGGRTEQREQLSLTADYNW